MDGLMMDYPLTTQAILRRAEAVFGQREIVTRLSDNTLHRYTVETFCGRVRQLMSAMATLGIRPGDRVGTYCWNHYRHLELYFAISSMGAVLHTLNI
ncbi:MAG: AMP-binding protein, partial [Pseudomonadota bacterium]|nr:AMP-binding protein [Pseudomonadota bacterium]